jgi:hypothetical protein
MPSKLRSDVQRVLDHIQNTNPHVGTARDAFAGIEDLSQYNWTAEPVSVPIDRIDMPEPASRRDVVRYSKHLGMQYMPAVVLIKKGSRYKVQDGAHRIAARALKGLSSTLAFVGTPR